MIILEISLRQVALLLVSCANLAISHLLHPTGHWRVSCTSTEIAFWIKTQLKVFTTVFVNNLSRWYTDIFIKGKPNQFWSVEIFHTIQQLNSIFINYNRKLSEINLSDLSRHLKEANMYHKTCTFVASTDQVKMKFCWLRSRVHNYSCNAPNIPLLPPVSELSERA